MDCQSRRRKSSSFSGEEGLRKIPRLWIHAQDTGMQGNIEQSLQGPDVSAQHNQQQQQQQHRPNEPVPLSLQAAMALQEIRSSIDKHSLLQQQPAMVGQPDIKFQFQQQQVSQEQQLKALLDLQQQQQMPRKGNVPVHPVEATFASPPTMLSPSSGRLPSNPSIPSSSSSHSCSSSRLMQAKQFHTEQPRNPTNVWFSSAPAVLDLPAPRAMVPSQFINSMFSLEFPERAIAVSGGLLVEQKQDQQAHQCEKLQSFIGGAGSMQHIPASTYAGQVCSSNNLNHNRNSMNNKSNVVNNINNQRSLCASNLVERTAAPATPPLEGSKDRKKKDTCTEQPKAQTRTFTKVYKLGSIGRAIDVGRFSNYVELKAELSRMFGLDGLLDQKNGWQLVFVDKENDLLLVGDDPWEEFVNSVRGIRILSPSEVSYYTSEEASGDCLV